MERRAPAPRLRPDYRQVEPDRSSIAAPSRPDRGRIASAARRVLMKARFPILARPLADQGRATGAPKTPQEVRLEGKNTGKTPKGGVFPPQNLKPGVSPSYFLIPFF
jgi:hypothetical protein